MSAETRTALEAAIEAHIIDESRSLPGAFLLVIETTRLADLEYGEATMLAESRGSVFTTRGLVAAWLDTFAGTEDHQ